MVIRIQSVVSRTVVWCGVGVGGGVWCVVCGADINSTKMHTGLVA
jgi:hypothetical protein